MGDNDKPFICKYPECYMTFSNEDHLNVHSKKHDMVLNLGLTKTNAIADQTPTPTRFIRNCEEVGLFQDLQNVNPFEETFRKAVENGKNGVLHLPELTSEDSLHTPQIFHTIEKKLPEKYGRNEMPDDFLRLNSSDSTKTECNNGIDDEICASKAIYTSVIFSSKTEIEISSSNSEDTMTTDDGISNQDCYVETVCKPTVLREKLKEVLEKRKLEEDPLEIRDTEIIGRRPRLDLKSKIPFLPVKQKKLKREGSDINIYDKNVSEIDKRRMMNRMAQMRSRERKKIWLDHMEEEIARLKAENKNLVSENQKLKEENADLKTVLLKHNNCSLKIDIQKQIPASAPKMKTYKTRPTILSTAPPAKLGPQVSTNNQISPVENLSSDMSATQKVAQPAPKELLRILPKPITTSVITSVITKPTVRQKGTRSPIPSQTSPIFPKSLTAIRPNTNPSSMYIQLNVPQTVLFEIKPPNNKKTK